MRLTSFIAGLASLVVMTQLGCWLDTTFTDSATLMTDEMYCTFEVTHENGAAIISATFTIGPRIGLGNRPIVLTGGDTISVNGVELLPSGTEDALRWWYVAALEPAELYVFEFVRPGQGTYPSTTTAPPEVLITAPGEGALRSRAAGFAIEWQNNSSGVIALNIDHDITGGYACLYLSEQEQHRLEAGVADTGVYEVSPGGLQNAQQVYGVSENKCPDNLPALITLERNADGQLDPHLTGTIHGRASGSVHFTSTP